MGTSLAIVRTGDSFNWRSELDFLALLRQPNRARLLEGALRLTRPAGAVTEYRGDVFTADVVEAGLLRVYQVALDGREATIGYGHPRECIGALPPVAPRPVVYVQAVAETTFLRIKADRLREMYLADAEVAQAIAIHTTRILASIVRVLTVRTLGGIAQKMAFDLLERACTEQLDGGALDFEITHEELANSIGSTREAVSRVVGQLRRARIIDASRGHIRVANPHRLVEVIYGLVT